MEHGPSSLTRSLNKDIIAHIFSFLSLQDLAYAALLDKTSNEISKKASFWQNFISIYFPYLEINKPWHVKNCANILFIKEYFKWKEVAHSIGIECSDLLSALKGDLTFKVQDKQAKYNFLINLANINAQIKTYKSNPENIMLPDARIMIKKLAGEPFLDGVPLHFGGHNPESDYLANTISILRQDMGGNIQIKFRESFIFSTDKNNKSLFDKLEELPLESLIELEAAIHNLVYLLIDRSNLSPTQQSLLNNISLQEDQRECFLHSCKEYLWIADQKTNFMGHDFEKFEDLACYFLDNAIIIFSAEIIRKIEQLIIEKKKQSETVNAPLTYGYNNRKKDDDDEEEGKDNVTSPSPLKVVKYS